MRAENFFSLLNQTYRKKSILSQEKRTYSKFFQFKFAKSDLKILEASKFGGVEL